MKPVLVFDMHETRLDKFALDPTFARTFDQAQGWGLRAARRGRSTRLPTPSNWCRSMADGRERRR